MKVSEYIRRKNAIIEKATGLTLVPEDQIIDMEPVELSSLNDLSACPYCKTFPTCDECPMWEAGNICVTTYDSSYGDSTYNKVYKKLGNISIVNSGVAMEIASLIEEYNKSNGFI